MKNIINYSFLFCLLTLISTTAILADSPTARVVNGSNASQGEYPFAAFLEFTCNGQGSWMCGGSYIGGQLILTAGHCVADLAYCNNGWSATATLNRADLNSSNGQVINVKVAYLHPSYNIQGITDNDIAALELYETPLGITPLSTVNSSQSAFYNDGQSSIIMGWGDMTQREEGENVSSTFPDIMQEAVVPVRSNAACSLAYGDGFDANAMFCAGILDNGSGNVGTDTCQGDSGGPIVINDSGTLRQIGIVSFGSGCASSEYYGVYTKLISYTDYISDLLLSDADEAAPVVTLNSGRCNGTTCNASITCNDPAPSIGIKSVTARLRSRDGGANFRMRVSSNDGINFSARKKNVTPGRYNLNIKCTDYKLQSASASKRVKAK